MSKYPPKIHLLKSFEDNYIFVIADEETREAAVVDPGSASCVVDFLNQKNLKLTKVFVTHHHHDHISGILELKKFFPDSEVYGSYQDWGRIPGQTKKLSHKDQIHFSRWVGEVLSVPGHTAGHIIYNFAIDSVMPFVFVGDTIFLGGCGRVFESTMSQMFSSLLYLRSVLSDNSFIYCAHEYSLMNYSKLIYLEPENIKIKQRLQQIKSMRANNAPTVPFIWGAEKQTSSIFRWDDPDLKKLTCTNTDEETFVAVRNFLNQSLSLITHGSHV